MDVLAENIRWYFNDESVALYTYEENDDYPLDVTLSRPIPGVTIQIVQASLDVTLFDFNSNLTANLSVLIQEGVNNISCGSILRRSDAILTRGNTVVNRPPLGPAKVSLLEGWPHFRGEFKRVHALGLSKWPEYRGGHISGVLIRGVPL